MRIPMFMFLLAAASAAVALEPAKGPPEGGAGALVARHSEVADVVLGAIEGKPVEGPLLLKPLLKGEQMTLLELHYQAGTKAPIHSHSHESVIYVVSGKIKTTIGDSVYILGPGDAARHPQGVPHTVEALVESTVLEVKSPATDIRRFLKTSGTH